MEPHVNGPYTPDLAWPISKFAAAVKENGYPAKLEVGLIGSCTNSSYEDLDRAASIARQAKNKKLKAKSEFTITPGSEQIRYCLLYTSVPIRSLVFSLTISTAGRSLLINASSVSYTHLDVYKRQE